MLLGYLLEEKHPRWLTDDEIAGGVMQAIRSDQEESIIGLIEPWNKRPLTLVNNYSI